ncbi:hypothetical protein ABZW32_39750, partial [Streptomyces sp. NPDC004667]|uniref:hypothetical protein n=1 Tax=Streptomyces sp. NPDC004667 TaxID=3154285 RepID=UPI0033A5E30D
MRSRSFSSFSFRLASRHLRALGGEHAPALIRDRVQATADAFEQAARAPGARCLEGRARAGWRDSTRALERAPRAARGG